MGTSLLIPYMNTLLDKLVEIINSKMVAATFTSPGENCVESCLNYKPSSQSIIVKVICISHFLLALLLMSSSTFSLTFVQILKVIPSFAVLKL